MCNLDKVNSGSVLKPAASSAHTDKNLKIPKQMNVLAKYDLTADLELQRCSAVQFD